MSLRDILVGKELIVCVGPGGVGKTTVSAALGLAAARAGRRVFVLTIDPARRLADALGLDGLDDKTRRVPTEVLGDVTGSLEAAMVDTGASFDALIERITDDQAKRDRIFGNRVYRAVSRSLSRSHAYVAMERLYHATSTGDYDLVVLDTPPARNAIDILDAPMQLARFLEGRIVSWFLPSEEKQGIVGRIFSASGRVATQLLGRVTGRELLDGIVEFLEAFASLREGFEVRARAVDELLRGSGSAFVLVSSASPSSADDAGWMRDDLARRGVELDAMVFNQSYVALRPESPLDVVNHLSDDDVPDHLAAVRDALPDAEQLEPLARRMRALRIEGARDNQQFQRIVDGLAAELPRACVQARVPRLADEVRDLPSLSELAGYLLAR